jgi:MFS family permease
LGTADRTRGPSWLTLFGYLFFIGMMAVGYYYNLTFVQFGLIDLGERVIGMSEQAVVMHMALLALITTVVAVLVGFLMMRRGWSRQFMVKLRLAFGVVLTQTVLTAVAPTVDSAQLFLVWIVIASVALGVGVPATFSMTSDLIRVRHRGYVAALITAGAYFPAAVFSADWTVQEFSSQMIWLLVAGTASLGILAFARFGPLDQLMGQLGTQHTRPEFGRGRFVRIDRTGRPRITRRLLLLIVLMFGIFFVDSLGFLRLADTPFFFDAAWQSPEVGTRLAIGGAHVLAALVAGILYAFLGERGLFAWIFGIFALVHLMYTFSIQMGGITGAPLPLAMPLLYSVAVSLYTVLTFALWADISVPETISRNTALGVAISGWAATFFSTALALQMQLAGVPLQEHLRIVNSLAMILFLAALLVLIIGPGGGGSRRAASRGGGD